MRKLRKSLSSLLIFTLMFALLFPLTVFASDEETVPLQHQLGTEARAQMQEIIQQNESINGEQPILHPDLQNLTGDEDISVIVQLSESPVALTKGINTLAGKAFTAANEKSTQQKVVNQQQKFLSQLSKTHINSDIKFTYNYAFNGLALTVKANQVKQLLTLDGVKSIEPDIEVHALGESASKTPEDSPVTPMMNTSNPFLEVPSVWALGYKGQGVKVAILDTGIDYYHPELKDVYKGGYNFISQKVDGTASGYARTRADNDPYETTPLDRPANRPEIDPSSGSEFYTEHGTHVAGTIAAQGNNPYGIKGLAPEVELYSYRVLGAYGSGANSGVIAGIDKAAAEKMDIINLSLGGSTNSQVSSDAIAINNAALAGTTACVATGNSGPNRGTIGSPSTAAFAISVGNSTVPGTAKAGTANISLFGAVSPTAYNMNLMAWKFGTDPADTLTGTYDIVAIPNYGRAADFNGLDVKGKVALISRGDGVAFVEKIANAKENGAAAVIMHNFSGGTNAPGPSGAFLGDSFAFIPTFDMSYTDGNALRTALATKTATVTFSNFTTSSTAGDDINDSSSRGPANPVFDIKPDISAPGTNIMSSIPAFGKDYLDQNLPLPDYSESYDRFTGTSMATPHVTGIAALLKSEHPDWTPFDIKVAIANTAKQLDVTKYDVFSQGAGRIQPLKAATTEALAYSYEQTSFSGKNYDNIKGSVTFGNVTPDASNTKTLTRNIIVKNLAGSPSDYNVSVQVTKKATGTLAAASVSVNQTSFTLTGEQQLTVSLTVPKGTGTVGNELLGYIHIDSNTTHLILPFAASFAPPTGLKTFTLDSSHISPNGDGKLDSTTLRYEFYDRQYATYIELYDLAHPDAGYYGDGSLGWIVNSSSTTTGAKTLNFTGKFHPWEQTGSTLNTLAPDGVYAMALTTLNQAQNAIVAFSEIPVFIKKAAPKIIVDDTLSIVGSTYAFSGSIDDPYTTFGPLIEDEFDLNYNLNDNLHVKAELTDSNNLLVSSEPVTLQEDGTFKLDLTNLSKGTNQLKLTVDDAAGNHAEKVIKITSVDPILSRIKATPESLTIGTGLTADLNIQAQYEDSQGNPIHEENITTDAVYSGYDPTIVSVEQGKVTALATGDTLITVTYKDQTTTVPVSVVGPSLTGITAEPNSFTLDEGNEQQLTVLAHYQDIVGNELTPINVTDQADYSNYDPAIVSVDEQGKLTAVAAGTTTILVSYENYTSNVDVTVTDKSEEPVDPGIPNEPSDPGQTPTDPGETPPSNPGETPPSNPGETPPSNPGETPPSDPGETPPSDPGETPPSDPGETPPSDPGETPPSDPGETPPSDPGETPPSDPGETLPSSPDDTVSYVPVTIPVTSPTSPTHVQAGIVSTIKNTDGTTSALLDVSNDIVIYQLQDPKTNTITLNISDFKVEDNKEVSLTLNKELADKLLSSGKGLSLIATGFNLDIPANSLTDFINENGFKLVINVTTKEVTKTNIVSPVVTISSDYGKLHNPIVVTIKPDLKYVSDLQKVGSYYQDEHGKWNYVGFSSTRSSINIRITTSTLGTFAAIENHISFTDVVNHWAQKEVEVIASQHVTNGKSSALFAPNDTITHAEFAAMLDRILGVEKEWSQYASMQGAANPLTREEMVSLIVKTLGVDLTGTQASISFKDKASISANAQAAVAYALNIGLINGVEGNKFAPTQSSTRAQVAVVLYRLMKFMDKI